MQKNYINTGYAVDIENTFNFFQQLSFVAKAKRQVQMFYVTKVKRQLQKSPASIVGEMNAGLSCFSEGV
ncbi:hypothetical protein [Lysinibacillus sp. NPDC092081]|uniref:hypothetical protein n=1 Tax=Lysinibacillus sp. NPDC092081 TaxID=3364131 RepID=UPI003826972B